MKKPKMHSPDLTQDNIARLHELFPSCVTEAKAEDGTLKFVIDFDQLRQELAGFVVEGASERYQLSWPGKREAQLMANAPIAKTLRPSVEQSKNFELTRNIFIEGDNLDALKLLQETYLGKVGLIYIDPPYNTGGDFIYADKFAQDSEEYKLQSNQTDSDGNRLVANQESNGRFHSDWLSMMYSRLKLARNILAEDGAIVVHIDENEYVNLEKIMSEIFGEENNLGTIVWDKRNPKGDATGIAQQHELISIYCKDKTYFKQQKDLKRPKENAQAMLRKVEQLISTEGGITEAVRTKYREWLGKQEFSGGEKAYSQIDVNGDVWRPVSMAWPNKKKAPADYFIPLTHPVSGKECPLPARGWRNPSSTMRDLLDRGLIVFGEDESTQPQRKYLLKENLYENIPSLLYFGGSDDALLSDLEVSFDNPKPVAVVKRMIQSLTLSDDIVMDFFAGSATTAHAVLQLNSEDGGNRRFIMVQLQESCSEESEAYSSGFKSIAQVARKRIDRAGQKVISEQHCEEWNRDIGFRTLIVDSSNMADVYYAPDALDKDNLDLFVDNIKQNRTSEDLLFQVMLDWGVDLTLPIAKQTIQDKEVIFVDGNALAACFNAHGSVDEGFVKELATHQPLRVVFRDAGFKDRAVKINIEQIFKLLSPATEVKCI